MKPYAHHLRDGRLPGIGPHDARRTHAHQRHHRHPGQTGARRRHFACDTTQYPHIARRYRAALAAGPLLVSGGKIIEYDSGDSFYTHRHPRSLIGKRPNGEVVMAVIDGRAKGQAAGATIAETAYIARLLGLTDALNLDGGGSSALWTHREGGGQPTPATTPLRPCRRTRRTKRHRRPSAEIKGQF